MRIIELWRGTATLKAIALSLLLGTGGTTGASAQDELSAEEMLKRLERLQQEGERFQSHEFRLLWAREAFRHGNIEGAMDEWMALADEGNSTALYVLQLLLVEPAGSGTTR